METMTYTLNTRTPAAGYHIMTTSSGVMLWAVAIKCGWVFWVAGRVLQPNIYPLHSCCVHIYYCHLDAEIANKI